MLEPLSEISYSIIVDTINSIFSDYEYKIQWKVEKFVKDIEEFSINLNASLAYIENDSVKALSLTCIRGKRARMDSFGVVPSERRRGIATFLLENQIRLLRQMGIKEYELEVLKTNANAVNFYKKNNFEIVDSLISLYSPLPPKGKNILFEKNFKKALSLSKSFSDQRNLCWIREPESLGKSDRYTALVSGNFYVFYFTAGNQCFIVDAFGDDIESKLLSFFGGMESSLFSIVSLSSRDYLYKFLVKNNFMEFSEQWKMKMYL
jgi:GNAT superfamily N-acetyltransferase